MSTQHIAVALQRVQAVMPPVEVVFFLERADRGELLPHALEMLVQCGWRRVGTVAAGHGGIVPQMAGVRTRG